MERKKKFIIWLVVSVVLFGLVMLILNPMAQKTKEDATNKVYYVNSSYTYTITHSYNPNNFNTYKSVKLTVEIATLNYNYIDRNTKIRISYSLNTGGYSSSGRVTELTGFATADSTLNIFRSELTNVGDVPYDYDIVLKINKIEIHKYGSTYEEIDSIDKSRISNSINEYHKAVEINETMQLWSTNLTKLTIFNLALSVLCTFVVIMQDRMKGRSSSNSEEENIATFSSSAKSAEQDVFDKSTNRGQKIYKKNECPSGACSQQATYCKHCGAKLIDTEDRCDWCGKPQD